MRKINWLKVGITSAVVLSFLVGVGVIASDWSYHGWGMMGPGRTMMEWSFSPLGWIRLIATWLIPISLIVLALFGIFWLMRDASKAKPILS